MTSEADLGGCRVMVVEDEFYLATDTARALERAGAVVVGPFGNEIAARAAISAHRPDVVILDINLGEGASFALARHLKDIGAPFLFVTGYDARIIPLEFEGIQRFEKPVQLEQIISAIGRLMAKAT